ncbi:hypothetical protein [Actinomadura sp. GTD37]|uniref:hypothetical protein n=1 Tax=Actinomadura sp. GTD37 TaxID=1778030 RepID=UPI0035C1ECFC
MSRSTSKIGILAHAGLFLAEEMGTTRAYAERARDGHYRALRDVEGVGIRLQGTARYNSIYGADDGLLINPHAYGIVTGPHAPTRCLAHLRGRRLRDEVDAGRQGQKPAGVMGREKTKSSHRLELAAPVPPDGFQLGCSSNISSPSE